MTLVAVSVGALSKPGVDTGIGSAIEAVSFALQRFALDHHLVADRFVDQPRFDRIGDSVVPLGLDVLDLGIHANRCKSPDWRRWRRPPPEYRICGRARR